MKRPETRSLTDFVFCQTEWMFVSGVAGISAGDRAASDCPISPSNASIAAAGEPRTPVLCHDSLFRTY